MAYLGHSSIQWPRSDICGFCLCSFAYSAAVISPVPSLELVPGVPRVGEISKKFLMPRLEDRANVYIFIRLFDNDSFGIN